jgi:hypothetical protein
MLINKMKKDSNTAVGVLHGGRESKIRVEINRRARRINTPDPMKLGQRENETFSQTGRKPIATK